MFKDTQNDSNFIGFKIQRRLVINSSVALDLKFNEKQFDFKIETSPGNKVQLKTRPIKMSRRQSSMIEGIL